MNSIKLIFLFALFVLATSQDYEDGAEFDGEGGAEGSFDGDMGGFGGGSQFESNGGGDEASYGSNEGNSYADASQPQQAMYQAAASQPLVKRLLPQPR